MLNAANLPLDSLSLSQEAMTQLQIGIQQSLPYPGTLALREELARHESQAAEREVAELRLKLARDVKTLWWNLFYLDRALENLASNRQLTRQLIEVAQTKYKVGEGLQQDVLQAQLELSRLLEQQFGLQGMRRGQEARLNALLSRPVATPIVLPMQTGLALAPIGAEAGLQARAQAQRPALAAQGSQIDAARSRVRLAKQDYYPDFNLGAVYGLRAGANPDGSPRSDFLSLQLSMNLPLFSDRRLDRKLDQQTSLLLQQRYRLQSLQDEIRAEVAQAVAEYRRIREQLTLLAQGILPQARQTVASMLAAYQVNKVDFLSLSRVQITLFNYEIRYWQTLAQGKQALAQLAAAVGAEDEAQLMAATQTSEVNHD